MDEQALVAAAGNNDIDLMYELHADGIPVTVQCAVVAARYGNIKALTLLKLWDCGWSTEVAMIAALSNNALLVSLVCQWRWCPAATDAAAEQGKLTTLRTLMGLGMDLTEEGSGVLDAINAYEDFMDMEKGSVTFTTVQGTAMGIEGWKNWSGNVSSPTVDIRDITNPPPKT